MTHLAGKLTLLLVSLMLLTMGAWAKDGLPVTRERTKLMLVEVHADWCPRCKRVTPVFEELQKDYASQKNIRFVVLDVTSKASKVEAAKKAEMLGLAEWFTKNRSKTSMVGVFKMPERKLVKTFANQANKQLYVDAITESLKQ